MSNEPRYRDAIVAKAFQPLEREIKFNDFADVGSVNPCDFC